MEFSHESVLLGESVQALNVRPDGIYVDGTAGGGGHSFAIAERLAAGGRLVAIDRDPDAVEAATRRLEPFRDRAVVVHAAFSTMADVLCGLGVGAVDGILLDLGVSSHQFDVPERGFSYQYDAPLDMRMSRQGPTAADFLRDAPFEEIARVLREYGEERFAGRIASRIVERRMVKPIGTTLELAELVRGAIPAATRRQGPNPARRTFQALRIQVNGELDELNALLEQALSLLKPEGRLCIITFQSLEDRMVKQRFAAWAKGCTCPPDFPVCVCGKKPQVKLIIRHGVEPSPEELERNPRSRSARLRTAEKLPPAENVDSPCAQRP